MKFYIDFEATQPENEIIAIGAVCEDGTVFHSLIKPQLSSISQYISQMTGISQEDLDKANSIDEVFKDFDNWVGSKGESIMDIQFISYGDDDKFVKATLPAIKDEQAFTIACYLMAKMENCSKQVSKFFHGTISLINAFNYLESLKNEQKHNPLEDAIMLRTVLDEIATRPPLDEHPLSKKVDFNMPHGTFFCKPIGKNSKERMFESCEEAINWIIETKIPMKDRENVHHDRIMKNIMKSVRTGAQYSGYRWRRIKESA